MEANETWPAQAAAALRLNSAGGPKTLNEDPFNVYAEELALQECQKGFVVERQLAETDFLMSSCGCHIQGTPDGGFIDSEGSLRLVQVVRVPLLPDMNASAVGDILYNTILAKIVKSQTWMRATCTLPCDFTIFCWLPPVGAYDVCLRDTEALLWTDALLWNVRSGGWPFSLRIEVPQAPSKMFPLLFGGGGSLNVRKDYFSGLSFLLDPSDYEDSDTEDETLEWYLFGDPSDEEAQDGNATADAAYDAHALALLINMVEGREPAVEAGVQALAALLGIEAEAPAGAHRAAPALCCRRASPGPAGPPRFAARGPRAELRADIAAKPTWDAPSRPTLLGLPLRARGAFHHVRTQGLCWWGDGIGARVGVGVGAGSLQMERAMLLTASAAHELASHAPRVF
mmetsp:Transcript_36159/g.103422  ORF Transcript_36159/g.103422 Transcript_36159/m.103422 type:complete len:399 (+) Transcript_36159:54-1250(+)